MNEEQKLIELLTSIVREADESLVGRLHNRR